MKRAASAILLSLFLYNIVGYYFAFTVSDLQNRSEMSLNVKNSKHLETLRIHRSDLNNALFDPDKKEILYKGEMYDVKSQNVDGEYIVFHCINDSKEKNLLANLNDNTKNNIDTKSSSSGNHPDKSGQKNITKDYFCNAEVITFFNYSVNTFFRSPDTLVGTFVVSLSPPPPDQV